MEPLPGHSPNPRLVSHIFTTFYEYDATETASGNKPLAKATHSSEISRKIEAAMAHIDAKLETLLHREEERHRQPPRLATRRKGSGAKRTGMHRRPFWLLLFKHRALVYLVVQSTTRARPSIFHKKLWRLFAASHAIRVLALWRASLPWGSACHLATWASQTSPPAQPTPEDHVELSSRSASVVSSERPLTRPRGSPDWQVIR